MLLSGGKQNASDEYSSVAYICHRGSASDAFLCMIADHSKGASLLLAQSEKTESEYTPFPFVTRY